MKHKKSQIPEIRIQFSELLYDNESRALAEAFNLKLESKEHYWNKNHEYWSEWQKYEKEILHSLQKVLDVKFYSSVIDVNVAPFFISKSSPLILNFSDEPDRFVDVLLHELCHILLTDNLAYQQYNQEPNSSIVDVWRGMFGNDYSQNIVVHIPVHALCKYIYLDVLNSQGRLERDIQACKGWQGSEEYLASWDYVQAHDYHEIIKQLRESYHGS